MPSKKNSDRRRAGRPAFPMLPAIWVIAVLIFLPLALILALHIPSVQKELITWAAKQIENATDYKIELQSFAWVPFSGLRLENVRVQTDGTQILSCEDVNVSYRLSMTSPFLFLEDIYLKQPFIQLERTGDGKWLIPAGGPAGRQDRKPGPTPSLQSFPLPNIHIESGKIEATQQGKTILSIKDITGVIHLKSVQGPNGPAIRLDLDNFHAQADVGALGQWTAACTGTVEADEVSVESGSLSGPDNSLIEFSGQWDATSSREGKATVRLSRFVPTAIPALSQNVSFPGPVSGKIEMSFQNDILRMESSSISSPSADFKFSAAADLGGLPDPYHAGTIKAEISLEKASFEKLNSSIPERFGGIISFEARYDPGNFGKPALWHGKVDTNLDIPGLITLKASGAYQNEVIKINYDLDCREIQKLAALFPRWEGKGRVASRGSLSGTWPDMLWEGEITSPRFQYLSVQAEQVSIKGKGKAAGREDRHEISLKAQNVFLGARKIAALNLDVEQQKDTCLFKLNGDGILSQISAHLSGRVEKIWDFPLITLSSQGQAGFRDQTGSLECNLEMEKDGLRIHSASVQQGKQKITISDGVVADTKTDMRITLESVNAGQITNLLGLKDAFNGTVSGRILVSGRPDQPECRLDMEASNCTIPGGRHIDQMLLQGNYAKEMLQVQGEMKTAPAPSPVNFSAKVPLLVSLKPFQFEIRQSGEFNCDVKAAAFDAGTILPYLTFLNKLGGQMEGDVHAEGNLRQPVVSGSGTWKNGFFLAKSWSHIADNIQAEWSVDSRNINVKRAEVSHLGGSTVVTGFIEYPEFETMAFKADGTDLDVHDIYGIDGKVSGQAEIKQTAQTAELTGNLRFSRARMNLGQLETDIARDIQIVDGDVSGDLLEIKEVKDPGRFYRKLRMDVRLELPASGTWVTGKGLQAEISGGLKLEKSPSGAVCLRGELQALRGTYNFQGNELKITEGTLVFTGTPEPDPRLRIISQKQVKDVVVQALVSGPLSHPKLTLSSVPSMNQVDILSYFMFDHPAGDLSTNERSQFQDRAAAWLGSQTSGMIKNVFGNSPLAPDAVGYRSTSGTRYNVGFTNNPIPVTTAKDTGIVELGKYITPDLYVKYGRSITGEQGNEVQVEYRLNRHISIQTQVGVADQSGVDIFWRHDFGK